MKVKIKKHLVYWGVFALLVLLAVVGEETWKYLECLKKDIA